MNLKDLAAYLIALAALAACVLFLHGVDSGLSGSDESSHFLNGYLIWAYLTEAAGANPLAYATDFYIHYPKISIGHWPPLYYVFLSALFFALPHAPAAFQCANLAVSALPAWLVARETRRAAGFPWAVTAAVACVTIPICVEDSTYLMLDQPLAAICFAAALIWSAYSRKPSLRLGLAFGSAAAIAILVKGNGWALALLPPFHAALAGRWRVLFDWRSFASAALVLVFVGAWTALTYRITSDGFQHAWGWAYFSQALPSFLGHTYANLGPVNALLALIGIGASLRSEDDGTRELGRSCLALILATLIFHSIVPVALDMRYISSALPPLAVFIALGLHALARRFASPLTAGAAWKWAIAGLIVVSAPGALFLRERPARYNMHMDAAAETLLHEYPKLVAVVDGSPGAEGAFASEVALR
ncbi:MAG: hypothetical protein LBS70_04445, partial [Candidatus Accumulibacter sp.]|nr:hypothetical protein [Accumulibacter sp.]